MLSATHDGSTATAEAVPETVVRALEGELDRLDPQADLTLELRCDACAHAWETVFDIAAFLWREVEVEARRMLRGVDVLARAYGWSEAEILALSHERRRSYLELVGAL